MITRDTMAPTTAARALAVCLAIGLALPASSGCRSGAGRPDDAPGADAGGRGAPPCERPEGPARDPMEAAWRWARDFERPGEARAEMLAGSEEARRLAEGWRRAHVLRVWSASEGDWRALLAGERDARGGPALLLHIARDGEGWAVEEISVGSADALWPGL